jgi:hypothetical protein
MFEDEEDISSGYGNVNEMMPQDPMAAGAGAPPPAEGQGGSDPLMEGVQAFMQTQDPQIAVQVVMMLAEQMGLGGGGQAPAPSGGQPPMPMGRNGMTISRPKLF